MYLNYFGKTFCDIWWKGDPRRKNVSDIECQEMFVPFILKKKVLHIVSNKAWYSWNLTSPNTMLAFEICKTYLKMILKVWEESVSNIFNTLFHKLNETFRGCIIANIWASQLHFIFQRYIFPDSQLWLYFIIILVCEWIVNGSLF